MKAPHMTVEEYLNQPERIARQANMLRQMGRVSMAVSLMLDQNVVEASLAYEPWLVRGDN
jgi:hypothetical protein